MLNLLLKQTGILLLGAWFLSILICGLLLQYFLVRDLFFSPQPMKETAEQREQVSDELLHKCFPGGVYNRDASVICPDVYRIVVGNLAESYHFDQH